MTDINDPEEHMKHFNYTSFEIMREEHLIRTGVDVNKLNPFELWSVLMDEGYIELEEDDSHKPIPNEVKEVLSTPLEEA